MYSHTHRQSATVRQSAVVRQAAVVRKSAIVRQFATIRRATKFLSDLPTVRSVQLKYYSFKRVLSDSRPI